MKYFQEIVLILFGLILFSSEPVEARRIKVLSQHSYRFLTNQEINKIAPSQLSKGTFIEDEEGKIFIIYEKGMAFFTAKNLSPQGMSGTIQREYLAYLLSEDLCNAAEVRIINKTDAERTPLEVWMQKQDLTEIGITRFSQDYQPEELIYQEHTLERMLTLWIWLRDNDHGLLDWNMLTFNRGREDLHLSYDHDAMITTGENDYEDFGSIVWMDIVDLIKIHNIDTNVLRDLAHYVQLHYSDVKIREIIGQIGFNEESEIDTTILLNSLILRRNILIDNIEAILEKTYSADKEVVGFEVSN